MRIFAIKDLNTELYVTRFKDLDLLGDTTKLFDKSGDAFEYIELSGDKKLGMFRFPAIYHQLAWADLERKYKTDRWHLDIHSSELIKMLQSYDLKVVELVLDEKE